MLDVLELVQQLGEMRVECQVRSKGLKSESRATMARRQ